MNSCIIITDTKLNSFTYCSGNEPIFSIKIDKFLKLFGHLTVVTEALRGNEFYEWKQILHNYIFKNFNMFFFRESNVVRW